MGAIFITNVMVNIIKHVMLNSRWYNAPENVITPVCGLLFEIEKILIIFSLALDK